MITSGFRGIDARYTSLALIHNLFVIDLLKIENYIQIESPIYIFYIYIYNKYFFAYIALYFYG